MSVVGDLDLATLPQFRAAVDRLDGPAMAVDLTSAAYLDTVVLGVVLGVRVRAARTGATFVVVCPEGPVHDLLVESGVTELVDVVAAVDALEEFAR